MFLSKHKKRQSTAVHSKNIIFKDHWNHVVFECTNAAERKQHSDVLVVSKKSRGFAPKELAFFN